MLNPDGVVLGNY